jgi:hypothetical protein
MRAVRIFAIGTAAFIALLLITLWIRWAALVIAALPMAMILVGQFIFPQSKRSFRVWMDPEILGGAENVRFQLSGKNASFGFFKRWYEFEIQVHNLWLWSLVAMASLAALGWLWGLHEIPMPGGLWYYAGSAWMLVVYLAWRWMWERRALQKSGFALGSFHVAQEAGPAMRRVVYQYIDDQGQYRRRLA